MKVKDFISIHDEKLKSSDSTAILDALREVAISLIDEANAEAKSLVRRGLSQADKKFIYMKTNAKANSFADEVNRKFYPSNPAIKKDWFLALVTTDIKET